MEQQQTPGPQGPSNAFIGASRMVLLIGVGAFLVALWNAAMELNEKGFYAMSFVLSLFSAIAVQKNTGDMKASKKNEH